MASFENSTYFQKSEFNHPEKMDQEMIAMLDVARAIAGVSFHVTSDWREKGDGKSHHLGKAVDIRVSSSFERGMILHGARKAGFTRVGIYYSEIVDGHHKKGHVHLDTNTEADGFPQNRTWIGKSRR